MNQPENNTGTCMPRWRPESCYLPYPKEYFNEGNLLLENSNSFIMLQV